MEQKGRQGHPPLHLRMPEYYADHFALPHRAHAPDVHLIFRSTEQIRLLKPAVNICCFAWEFPVLKTDTLPGEHPFANQRAMLSLCDEIWTASGYARDVLRAHGVPNVYHIPAPVPRPDGGRRSRATALAALSAVDAVTMNVNFAWPEPHQIQQTQTTHTSLGRWIASHGDGRRPPLVFLSVLNPEDFRKHLDPMLRGFHHVRQRHPNAVLIVKALVSGHRMPLAEVAGSAVRNKLAPGTVLRDDGIAIINAYLSDDDMSMLYSLADCYLCTSLAEGQNLPLLEAMAHGTVAITTRNTAMLDYIDDDNGFVIPTRPVVNEDIHLAATVTHRAFDVSLCTSRDVYETLCGVLAAKPAARTARAKAGIETLTRQFAEAEIANRVAARLQHHAHRRPA
jgi:glycosyltransferase involved in cell wall biosynthesis